jgi:drug/metabolite transporter (DMT)-like permease
VLVILLGLGTALSYGFADFFAALAGRRVRIIFVTCLAAISGLVLLLTLSIPMGAAFSTEALLVGFAGGVFSIIALTALYASLALGPISVISPLGALVSAVVPTILGVIWLGERFGELGWFAILLAMVAVVLVAMVPGEKVIRPSNRAILLAIIAGIGIGLAVTAIDRAPADSGLATLIVLRMTAAIGLGIAAAGLLLRGQKPGKNSEGWRLGTRTWILIFVTGLLDACANVLFLLASREGGLAVVGVLTALYPLGTILLARIFLKERLAAVQKLGVVLALTASSLLAFSAN